MSTKIKLMLYKKVFHVDKNKVMMHQKNILCAKKLFFPERRVIILGNPDAKFLHTKLSQACIYSVPTFDSCQSRQQTNKVGTSSFLTLTACESLVTTFISNGNGNTSYHKLMSIIYSRHRVEHQGNCYQFLKVISF